MKKYKIFFIYFFFIAFYGSLFSQTEEIDADQVDFYIQIANSPKLEENHQLLRIVRKLNLELKEIPNGNNIVYLVRDGNDKTKIKETLLKLKNEKILDAFIVAIHLNIRVELTDDAIQKALGPDANIDERRRLNDPTRDRYFDPELYYKDETGYYPPNTRDKTVYFIQISANVGKVTKQKIASILGPKYGSTSVHQIFHNGRFKYLILPNTDYNNINNTLKDVKKYVKDAFIVETLNGSLVPPKKNDNKQNNNVNNDNNDDGLINDENLDDFNNLSNNDLNSQNKNSNTTSSNIDNINVYLDDPFLLPDKIPTYEDPTYINENTENFDKDFTFYVQIDKSKTRKTQDELKEIIDINKYQVYEKQETDNNIYLIGGYKLPQKAYELKEILKPKIKDAEVKGYVYGTFLDELNLRAIDINEKSGLVNPITLSDINKEDFDNLNNKQTNTEQPYVAAPGSSSDTITIINQSKFVNPIDLFINLHFGINYGFIPTLGIKNILKSQINSAVGFNVGIGFFMSELFELRTDFTYLTSSVPFLEDIKSQTSLLDILFGLEIKPIRGSVFSLGFIPRIGYREGFFYYNSDNQLKKNEQSGMLLEAALHPEFILSQSFSLGLEMGYNTYFDDKNASFSAEMFDASLNFNYRFTKRDPRKNSIKNKLEYKKFKKDEYKNIEEIKPNEENGDNLSDSSDQGMFKASLDVYEDNPQEVNKKLSKKDAKKLKKKEEKEAKEKKKKLKKELKKSNKKSKSKSKTKEDNDDVSSAKTAKQLKKEEEKKRREEVEKEKANKKSNKKNKEIKYDSNTNSINF